MGGDLSRIYLGSGHGEIKSLGQGYGENLRWMLKLSLDLPSPELILLQHGHSLFEISSVITACLWVWLSLLQPQSVCGTQVGTLQKQQPLSPTPAAGQREPLLLEEFPVVLQAESSGEPQLMAWLGERKHCIPGGIPRKCLGAGGVELGWELEVLAQTLVPGSATRGVSAEGRRSLQRSQIWFLSVCLEN